jgi:pimeloyl-ACP methyl ester carboxylesterase
MLGYLVKRTEPLPPTPVIVVPGTFWKDVAGWAETYSPANKPMQAVSAIFGITPVLFDWSGANSANERHAAAEKLARFVEEGDAPLVHLLGFSHGGNVASEAAAILATRVDMLITMATPVTSNYKTGGARRHINLYSPHDRMQILGGEGPFGLPATAKREFPDCTNIAIDNIPSNDLTGSHGNILWSDDAWRILRNVTLTVGLETRVSEG